MTHCTQESFHFPVLKRRIVEASFKGGDITSDGGVLLLQQVDRRLGLTEAVARTLDDPRRQASVDHDSLSLLRQRVYALALGYEDLHSSDTTFESDGIPEIMARNWRSHLIKASRFCSR